MVLSPFDVQTLESVVFPVLRGLPWEELQTFAPARTVALSCGRVSMND